MFDSVVSIYSLASKACFFAVNCTKNLFSVGGKMDEATKRDGYLVPVPVMGLFIVGLVR
jgi:hypothetical protein